MYPRRSRGRALQKQRVLYFLYDFKLISVVGDSARLLKHSLECDVEYYKAYSRKLEERLHRVCGERRFITEQLAKTQNKLFTLRKQVSALGATLLEHAGSEEPAGGAEGPRNMLTNLLREHVLFLGRKLTGLAGDYSGQDGVEDGDYDTSVPFSILAT